MGTSTPVLEIRDLTVSVPDGDRRVSVVKDVSFSIGSHGTVGLVGESGSGKTMTSLAIMGLLPSVAHVESGQILLDGEDVLAMSPRALRRIRGKRMAMVLQDPMTALDPSFTVRQQLERPLELHRGLRGGKRRTAVVEALEQVQLSAAQDRLSQYPHQLSGGMRQRVTSAIALAGQPRLLIADEPTTALDVTTQAHYLQLLRELQRTSGFAMLLVAHDLMVVRHVCERVIVMYAREVVEDGPADQVFTDPRHPYTRALLAAIPVMHEEMELKVIEGQAPTATERIEGCRFAARCEFAREVCHTEAPGLTSRGPDHVARCFGTEEGGWIDQ